MEAILREENRVIRYFFEYQFVDDRFNDMFSGEMLIGRLSAVFTALAIAISCLRTLWPGGLYCRATIQGDRHPESTGSKRVSDFRDFIT